MKRSRVCLDCRTVVSELPECPGGPKHRILDLATNGRALFVDEVWGPPSWRRERRRLARAGSGGAAAGALGDIFSGCDGCSALSGGGELGELLGALLVIVAVALAAMVLVWAIYKVVAYINAKRKEPKPMGALLSPARYPSRCRARGVVIAEGPRGASPITGEPCVGWAVELTTKRMLTSGVMLRDGQSFGFDVRLEDGRVARVPAGLLRLQRGGEEQTRGLDLDPYLATVDPSRTPNDEDPAIPFNSAAAIELRPGDEVELAGDLHLAPDPEAPQTYRGVAAMVLVPNEPIAVRKL